MFIYSKNLQKAGVTEEALRAAFDKDVNEMSERHKALRQLIIDRCEDGRDSQIKNWKAIAAIDKAYDVAHAQLAPTLIRDILSHNYTPKEVFEKLQAYGLDGDARAILDLERDPRTGGYKDVQVESPSFFKVLVPLVKAYVTIRCAKLYTDNDTFPLLKYTARRFTEENRIRAEIITDMVGGISSNYGYGATMRQSILQMLMYSNCLMFPREVWHKDKQLNEEGKEECMREGIRYHTPRPERTFFDRHYPTSTFNTDTGCEWGGFWQIERFSSISGNKKFWNKTRIKTSAGKSGNLLETAVYKNYFSEVYPCSLRWPKTSAVAGEQDRENDAAYYTKNEHDSAVVITTFYMKLVPSEWDLGGYDYPVWFRFIIANDDKIIFAQPVLYSPIIYWGYDADMNRVTSPSMALEVLPWQDHVGNILSQILLSSKQNLANAIFFDKNIVTEDVLNALKNKKESQLRSMNFVPFDSLENYRAGLNTQQAFHEFRFSKHNISELTGTLSTVISIMERLLVMSAQEIGGAATHEQSAREVQIIASNTGTRVAYTNTFIADAKSAWRRQLYYACMAYMKDNFPSQINPSTFPNAKKVLTEMGFSVDSEGGSGSSSIGIKAEKKKLRLEGFAEDRDTVNRLQEPAIATIMFQTLGAIANNPILAEEVGSTKILEGFTMAAHLAGAPPDWELTPSEGSKQLGQAREIAGQLSQMVKQITNEATGQAVEVVGDAVQGNAQQIQELKQTIDALLGAVEQAAPVPNQEIPIA